LNCVVYFTNEKPRKLVSNFRGSVHAGGIFMRLIPDKLRSVAGHAIAPFECGQLQVVQVFAGELELVDQLVQH
jgi:hypothetical protein